MREDSWSIFANTLRREMAKTSTSTHVLGSRLRQIDPTISDESVANWRRRRARPSLELLGPIVDALNVERRTPAGEDPFSLLGLLQEMNVVPETYDPELFDRAYRLLKIQLKQQDAEDALSELGRRQGATRVVQAAMTGSRWAVAVWPLYDGPDQRTRVHVSDRIDIHRLDPGEREVDDDVWFDPSMKNALRATNAMPSQHEDHPRWPNPTPSETSKWAISHVTSPREPIVSTSWTGLRGIALIATTRTGWVNEVASLVAFGLGYGLVTTSQLAMTAIGRRPDMIRPIDQYAFHRVLLDHPPHRRVWSHWGVPPEIGVSPFGQYSNAVDSTPRFVFLDESDALLTNTLDKDQTLEDLYGARARLRTAADSFPNTHLLTLPTEQFEMHTDRWRQVFTQAAEVLKWLSAPGRVTFSPRDLRETHAREAMRDRGVAGPFLDWLHSEGGWPTLTSVPTITRPPVNPT